MHLISGFSERSLGRERHRSAKRSNCCWAPGHYNDAGTLTMVGEQIGDRNSTTRIPWTIHARTCISVQVTNLANARLATCLATNKTAAQAGEKEGWLPNRISIRRSAWAPTVSRTAVNASEEFLGQRDDDARRASHVAEPVLVLVLGHLADEFGAVGAQASDSVVDAFDCKHDAPEAQRVRRCDCRFDLDQFWIAKLRQLKPPVPIWGPHHNDVDLDTFEPVDAVHPRALDRRLAFERHAERGEKSDSGCKVVDDDADVVQSLDRHVPSIAEAVRAVQADRSRELDVVSRANAVWSVHRLRRNRWRPRRSF